MTSQTLFILWPPSTNDLWRAVNGRNILSTRYRVWKEAAGKALMIQRPKAVKGPVELSISLCPPSKRPFDLDNRIKATVDLLVMHGLIEADDSRIVQKLTVGLHDGPPGARITIIPLAGENSSSVRPFAGEPGCNSPAPLPVIEIADPIL